MLDGLSDRGLQREIERSVKFSNDFMASLGMLFLTYG